MIPYGADSPKNELDDLLGRRRELVTDRLLNQERGQAKKEIDLLMRKGSKSRAFTRKNKKRNRRNRKKK